MASHQRYFGEIRARVAELADALDSGFIFERFPVVARTVFNRTERFDNTSDNALFARQYGAFEQKPKLAQKLAQLRRSRGPSLNAAETNTNERPRPGIARRSPAGNCQNAFYANRAFFSRSRFGSSTTTIARLFARVTAL